MEKNDRRKTFVLQSGLGVKAWLQRTPTCDEVRPPRCPICGRPSRPVGDRLGIWSHGSRPRQLRGPVTAEAEPELLVLPVRRYRCRGCHGFMTVVPRATVPLRLYSGSAIALAAALWGHERRCAAEVRRRVSPLMTFEAGWPTLGRWSAAVRAGRLLPGVRAPPGADGVLWAERAAWFVAAHAPPDLHRAPLSARAFAGAAHVG